MATLPLARGPSSESLQGENPREMRCRRCRARYGDLIAVLPADVGREIVVGSWWRAPVVVGLA